MLAPGPSGTCGEEGQKWDGLVRVWSVDSRPTPNHNFLLYTDFVAAREALEETSGPFCPDREAGEAGVDGAHGTRPASPTKPTPVPRNEVTHIQRLHTALDKKGWLWAGGSGQELPGRVGRGNVAGMGVG